MHHIFVSELSKELLEYDHLSSSFYYENLIGYLVDIFMVSLSHQQLKIVQQDTKADITVSLVIFQKHIHKLLQNICVQAINVKFMQRHLEITISRLIKDYIVLASHAKSSTNAKKIPRSHSSAAGLGQLIADIRGSIKSKAGISAMMPVEGAAKDSGMKRGNTSNMFISLYHSLLIDYPGTKKVGLADVGRLFDECEGQTDVHQRRRHL